MRKISKNYPNTFQISYQVIDNEIHVLILNACRFSMKALKFFTAALALRSRGLVIGSREEKEEKEREEEEKNLQIAIRCLWDLFD